MFARLFGYTHHIVHTHILYYGGTDIRVLLSQCFLGGRGRYHKVNCKNVEIYFKVSLEVPCIRHASINSRKTHKVKRDEWTQVKIGIPAKFRFYFPACSGHCFWYNMKSTKAFVLDKFECLSFSILVKWLFIDL